MKDSIKGIILGMMLIVVGVVFGGNALGWFNIDLFFDGWWTLFIIVPCAIGVIIDRGDRMGHFIGLLVGVFLLLACQNVISFDLLWKLMLPIIIVLIGLSIIFKNIFSKKVSENIEKISKNLDGEEILAVFSGQEIDMKDEKFKGKKMSAVFGGLKLDLRKAIIDEDIVIDANAIFGGIDILVPEDVIVKVKSSSLFGGVKSNHNGNRGHVIYVNGTAMFGGIEIK